MFKSSVRMCYQVPYDRPNLPAITVWRFVGLRLWFCEHSTGLRLCDLSRDDLNAQNARPRPKFPHVWIERTAQTLCSAYGIVTESCFEHFTRFWCSFPKSEAKFQALSVLIIFSALHWNLFHFKNCEMFLTHPVWAVANPLWRSSHPLVILETFNLTYDFVFPWWSDLVKGVGALFLPLPVFGSHLL
jgi:hypothetical protein